METDPGQLDVTALIAAVRKQFFFQNTSSQDFQIVSLGAQASSYHQLVYQ